MRWAVHFTLMLMLFAGLPSAQAAEPSDASTHFFDQTWGDFHEELARAKQEGKQGILIFFEMDECPFCHYMKQNVLNQPEVQEYYHKHFLNFTVDIEGDLEVTDFHGKRVKQKDFAFKEYRVRATPVIAFFDLNGKLIHRHTGKTAGVDEFMWMGQYVADGIYKQMPFTRYKRKKRAAENTL